jgi:hypothetical protein
VTARVTYAEAGAAMRAARARAAVVGLTVLEWQVFAVVAELTASWSKTTDKTSARRIAAMVYGIEVDQVDGGQRRRVRTALEALDHKGVITFAGARGGWNAGVIIGLPNVLSPEHVVVGATCPGEDTLDGATCSDGNPQRAPAGTLNVLPPAGNTEKGVREVSPSAAPSARDVPTARDQELAQRMLEHFERHGFTAQDCASTVAALKAEGVSDLTLDEAIGRAVAAGARKLGYVVRVARDWQQQRTGTRS